MRVKHLPQRKPYTPPITLAADLARLTALLPLAGVDEQRDILRILDAKGRGYDTSWLAARYERLITPDPERAALVERAQIEEAQ